MKTSILNGTAVKSNCQAAGNISSVNLGLDAKSELYKIVSKCLTVLFLICYSSVYSQSSPYAGQDGEITICPSNMGVIDLYAVISGEDQGGVWTKTTGVGGTFNAAVGTFTPTPNTSTSTFTYTVGNDTSLATINILPGAYAGEDGFFYFCSSSTNIIYFSNMISEEQPDGIWTRTSGSGGIFDAEQGSLIPTPDMVTSTFTYTVTAAGTCATDSSVMTAYVTPEPTASITYQGPFCNTVDGLQNVTLVGTGSYTGGTYLAEEGLVIDISTGAISASSSVPGTYTVSYIAPDYQGCVSLMVTATVTIENCGAAEGCGLGYWKNHTNSWCSSYNAATVFGDVFSNAPSDLAGLTLLQALKHGGGGIYNLARQGVAALLNSCSEEIAYGAPYSNNPQNVIDAVDGAYEAGGTATRILASALEDLNSGECPLSSTRSSIAQFSVYQAPLMERINVRYEFDYKTDVTIQVFDARGNLLMTQYDYDVYINKEVPLPIELTDKAGRFLIVKVITNRGFETKKVVQNNY